jgi:hypothetical protein
LRNLTFARILALAGTIAWAAALGAAFGAEPKPDFSIKSKAIEASVILDEKIKADPALAANCLAEGKAWAAKNGADADKEPELFRNGPWTMERKYETRSVVDGRYVSIVRDDYEYTGGAHPNSSSDTILWDKSAGKRISIRPFFTETADNGPTLKAMRRGVIASLVVEKKSAARKARMPARSKPSSRSCSRSGRSRWRRRPRKAKAPA